MQGGDLRPQLVDKAVDLSLKAYKSFARLFKGGRGQGDGVPCRNPQIAKFPDEGAPQRVNFRRSKNAEKRERPAIEGVPLCPCYLFSKTVRWTVFDGIILKKVFQQTDTTYG